MTSATYCPMPWMHLHVAVDGQVQPCCIGDRIGNIKTNKLENIWNGDAMKKIRLQMLNNEKPSECKKCFYNEDVLKVPSFRNDCTKEYSKYVEPNSMTEPDGSVKDMKLLYVDFRFNNLCNFKCRICSPLYSSAIGAEAAKFSDNPSHTLLNDQGSILYEEIKKQYDYVKKIYFAGGEPVMQKEHFQVLKDLINLGKAPEIILFYSSNGSRFKTGLGNMFDFWKHFKLTHINFSLDGYSKSAEYWRSGTDWNEIESNLKLVKEHKNIKVSVHSVVGWPNVFNWIEFIKYCNETDLIDDLVNIVAVTPITYPKIYALEVAPKFKKTQIVNALEDLKEYMLKEYERKHQKSFEVDVYNSGRLFDSIDTLIKSATISDAKLNSREFRNVNTKLDIRRNEDFFKAFPEHEDMRTYLSSLWGFYAHE